MVGGKKANIDGIAATELIGTSDEVASAVDEQAKKDDILISWKALNFQPKEKNLKWYLAVGGFIVLGLGYLIWTRDWFILGVFAVLIAITAWYIRTAKPKEESYKITPVGIWANDKLYPFSETHSFWVVYNQQVKMLYLAFLKKYLPSRAISLENVDPVVLKTILLKYIPEQEKRGEDLIDKLVRLIGL